MLTDRAHGLMQTARLIRCMGAAAAAVGFWRLQAAGADGPDSGLPTAFFAGMSVFLILMAFSTPWHLWCQERCTRPLRTVLRMTVGDMILVAIGLLPVRILAADAPDGSVGSVLLLTAPVLFLLNRYVPDLVVRASVLVHGRPRVLVVGSPAAVSAISHYVKLAQSLGVSVDTLTDSLPPGGGLRLFDPDRRYSLKDITRHLSDCLVGQDLSLNYRHVVCVDDDGTGSDRDALQELRRQCDAHGVPLTVCRLESSLPPWAVPSMPAAVSPLSWPSESRLCSPFNQMKKRAVDLLIAIPVVVGILPVLCVAVHLIHRRQSPGPLFYRQERCGRHGRRFRILKFRTMHMPAPGQTDIEDDPTPRIFPLGRLLRDSRLDEIPQFVNVLRGDMSIVGPRAHHIQDRFRFSETVPHYPLRMQARPGITGLAQCREYRGQFQRNSVADRVASDLAYITQWSLESDFLLMLQTAQLMTETLISALIRRSERSLPVAPVVSSAAPPEPTSGRQAA